MRKTGIPFPVIYSEGSPERLKEIQENNEQSLRLANIYVNLPEQEKDRFLISVELYTRIEFWYHVSNLLMLHDKNQQEENQGADSVKSNS